MALPCLLDDFDKQPRVDIERRKRSRTRVSPRPSVAPAIVRVGPGAVAPLSPSTERRTSTSATSISSSDGAATLLQLSTPSSDWRTPVSGNSITLSPNEAMGPPPASSSNKARLHHPENLEEYKRYSVRSRPITLVSELAIRQPQFGASSFKLAALAPAHSSGDPDTLDQLVPDWLAGQLSVWCEMHLVIWLPGLPAPAQIRRARRNGDPISASMRLLEVAQYVIAIQHASSSSAQALHRQPTAVRLTRIVEFYLSRCLFGVQRDLHAAQALELLSVFPLAVAYTDRQGRDRVESLEVSVFASAARRIAATCRWEYLSRKSNRLSKEGVHGALRSTAEEDMAVHTLREMELGLTWCSVCCWEFSSCLGSDDVIHTFSPRFMPTVIEVERLIAFARQHPVAGQAGLGQAFVLMRAHMIANVCLTLKEIRRRKPAVIQGKADPNTPMKEYTADLNEVLCAHEERMANSKALRDSWFKPNTAPEATVLLLWLDMEESSWFIVLVGITIFYSIQSPLENDGHIREFTPDFLTALIRNEASIDKHMRAYVFERGDDRLDTAESLLTIATQLSEARLGPERDMVVPPLTTSGVVLEACMLSMEVHGTSAKGWRIMPRRSRPWQQGMRGAAALLTRMHDVSEEEGGVLTTSARIINGMLDVIGVWERALSRSRIANNSALAPACYEAADGATTGKAPASAATTCKVPAPAAKPHDDRVAGVDIAIPPLATDGEDVSLDHLLRDMFGTTDWIDVLPSVTAG